MLTTTELRNHFLLAMPRVEDPLFKRSVILMCETREDGAIGLVVNRPHNLTMSDIFRQMKLPVADLAAGEHPVLVGGPLKPDRGFVLHHTFGCFSSTLQISESLAVTTSQDIIVAIAEGKGPEEYLFILGYSGWNDGQLSDEIMKGSWLHLPCNEAILFNTPLDDRFTACLHEIGIDESQLHSDIGHS